MSLANSSTEDYEFFVDALRWTKKSGSDYVWGDGSAVIHIVEDDNAATGGAGGNRSCVSVSVSGVWKRKSCDEKLHLVCERKLASLWSSWERWTPCQSRCHQSTTVRWRLCTEVGGSSTAPAGGNRKCETHETQIEHKRCNMHLCNEAAARSSACARHCNDVTRNERVTCKLPPRDEEFCRRELTGGGCGCSGKTEVDRDNGEVKWVLMIAISLVLFVVASLVFAWNYRKQTAKIRKMPKIPRSLTSNQLRILEAST